MLGVLKRRWKPKRASADKENASNNRNVKPETIMPMDVARVAPTPRQIRPLLDEKAQIVAYDASLRRRSSTRRSPDDPLPPSPNICVEGGRIEFVKSPSEGSSILSATLGGRSSRGFQTPSDWSATSGSIASSSGNEKGDIAKEVLEARIRELERLLDAEQKCGQRERIAVSRLQKQLSKKETSHRDVERERRLRADSEARYREVAVESERYRTSLAGLQREFNRMEETVRSMLQFKTRCELLNQEKSSLTAAYETRVQKYQNTVTKLGQENESLKQQLRLLQAVGSGEVHTALLERLRSLESENSALAHDADLQRRQYERCLDDIANQVVRALLSQKGLREEIGNLQRRIKDLENQNQALANILIHRLSGGVSDGDGWVGVFSPSSLNGRPDSPFATPSSDDKRYLRLSSPESLLLVPLQRPRSLNLQTLTTPAAVHPGRRCTHRQAKPALILPAKKPVEDESNESPESGNRDEGYSTMSSDVQALGETSEVSRVGLEDLKEASDETGEVTSALVPIDDPCDPDILFLPLSINPRHSFPPGPDAFPFQHVMRSFSDSHLCLRLALSPSVLALRRSKATTSLAGDESGGESLGSCGSGWWDQQWLRLGDNRQMELELDRSELENWSLSCDDFQPGLPSIREHDDSWSSAGSSCSDPGGEPSNNIGTDFTRDFYRLVKFESTKSLESNSSRRSNSFRETPSDRELALQNVLDFIAEQQQYVYSRAEEEDLDCKDLEPHEEGEDCYRKDCLPDVILSPVSGIQTEEREGSCSEMDSYRGCVEQEEVGLQRTENFTKCLEGEGRGLMAVAEEEELEVCVQVTSSREMVESLTSSLSTPDTVVVTSAVASPHKTKSDSPSGIPISIGKSPSEPKRRFGTPAARETKIPVIATRKLEASSPRRPKMKTTERRTATNIPLPLSRRDSVEERRTSPPDGVLVHGPTALGFHERASSKDVIEELNRMIRKGDEPAQGVAQTTPESQPLDMTCGRPTGWVHVEKDIDFTDPKARANLLDVMLASSDSSEVGSDSGGDEPVDYTHLHRLHRFRRHKKAAAMHEPLGALRCPHTAPRPTIIGRSDFFVRFGELEREAVSSFDFLEDLSTTSVSGCSSCDTLGPSLVPRQSYLPADLPSPPADVDLQMTPDTPSDDSDARTGGIVSFSDSCADSFSSGVSIEDRVQELV